MYNKFKDFFFEVRALGALGVGLCNLHPRASCHSLIPRPLSDFQMGPGNEATSCHAFPLQCQLQKSEPAS